MNKQNINVSWHLTNNKSIGQLHTWDYAAKPADYEAYLNQELDFPEYTLSYLKKSVELNLTKDTQWDIPIEHPHLSALEKAAEVYLRGVTVGSKKDKPKSGSYNIKLQKNPDVAAFAQRNTFYVFDANFYHRWNKKLELDSLPNKIVLGIDEENKTLFSVAAIISAWKENKVKEWSIVGGGVVSDTAAFAAHLCNCDFALYPTTLLGMVDACVGGKTGVNFLGLKNYIGTFNFPKGVYIYTDFLTTLPKNEFLSGMSEAFKHCLIGHSMEFAKDFLSTTKPPDISSNVLGELIGTKVDLIGVDANDQKKRNFLNFGHNLAHAIESLFLKLRLPVLHGEAVWIGILYDLILAKNAGMLDSHTYKNMKKLLLQFELKRPRAVVEQIIDTFGDSSFENLLVFLKKDKKNTGDFLISTSLRGWKSPLFPVVFDEASHSNAWQEISEVFAL